MTTFQQEYKVAFWHDPENAPDRLLRALAREYHVRTEEYDQLICRHVKGIGFPDGYTSSLSLKHARQIRTELLERCPWVWGVDLDRAISDEARHFESDWVNGRYRDVAREPAAIKTNTYPTAT